MRIRHVVTAAAAGSALWVGMLALAAETGPGSRADTFRQLELFGDVLGRVQSEYVSDTADAELIESAIQGMLHSLDPHSSYLDPESFRDMQVTTRGEYGGLGIEVTMEDGLVKVIAPMDDTPASRAGLISGDLLAEIDGEPILGLTLDEAIEKMRGPIGAAITLTVLRDEDEPFDVTLVRELITVKPVAWRVEEDSIGYIRVTSFNDQAADAVEDAVRDLKKELGPGLEGIVLDLRDNPGGLLDQAVAVADVFLDSGEVVSTRGRDPRDIERYNARPGDLIEGKPVVVLINQGSASAAEIVAGALQDRRRGTLIGRTSFGKGSVQTVIPLRGGRDGALRLTTAKYYTPSGRSIQATGIEPDLHIASRRSPDGEEGEEEPRGFLSEADLPNALTNESGEERHEELALEEPPADYPEAEDYQLKRAIDVMRGVELSDASASLAR
ncbi:MAG: S41 family peptidase [Caulobacterales bacterium]|nr:S41 family peptidase [Caulobacterales bacterium]